MENPSERSGECLCSDVHIHGYVFESQIFIDEKPAAYAFANETSNMTAAEAIAVYAPPDAESATAE